MAFLANLPYRGQVFPDLYVVLGHCRKMQRVIHAEVYVFGSREEANPAAPEGQPASRTPWAGFGPGAVAFTYDPAQIASLDEQGYDALKTALIDAGATNIRDVLEDENGILPPPPALDASGQAPLAPCCVRIRHDPDGKIVLSSQYAALDADGNPCLWLAGQRDDLADDLSEKGKAALALLLEEVHALNRDSLPVAIADPTGLAVFREPELPVEAPKATWWSWLTGGTK